MADVVGDMSMEAVRTEHELLDRAADISLVLLAVMATAIIALTQLRAMSLGWTLRDASQLVLVVVAVVAALGRRKLPLRVKASALVAVLLMFGVVGFATLGFFAAAVFAFPLAVHIAALFYGRGALYALMAGITLGTVLVATGFVTGRIEVEGPEPLLQSPTQWAVYLFTLACLMASTAYLIYKLRISQAELLSAVAEQRDALERRGKELEASLTELHVLRGIIPICSYCRSIRSDTGAWDDVEAYLLRHPDARFSHGVCPRCVERMKHDMGLDAEDAPV